MIVLYLCNTLVKVKTKTIKEIQSYIVAGKLLHLITLFEIVALIFLIPLILEIKSDNNILVPGLKVFLISYLICFPVFGQLDARSRYQNYKQIKDQIFIYGYNNRIFRPVLKSRCQRDAAWLAAYELNYGQKCKTYFHSNGYRWYHLFPDFLSRKPQFFFTYYFWKTTFFTPTYKPKFSDYKSNNILQTRDIITNPILNVE